jgi:hypothetical protein
MAEAPAACLFTGPGSVRAVSCNYDALAAVAAKCNGRQTCTIPTSQAEEGLREFLGGEDPCPGYQKELRVGWECMTAGLRSDVWCEAAAELADPRDMVCTEPTTIQVRWPTSCTHPRGCSRSQRDGDTPARGPWVAAFHGPPCLTAASAGN